MPTNKQLSNLRLRQMEAALRPWIERADKRKPVPSWIRAIREAIGMSQSQLARRLGITRVSARNLENRETAGTITLEALRRVAEAMGCDLVYALVPRAGSLDKLLDNQAVAAARSQLRRVDHTMRLEAQGVPARELREQERELADRLRREWSRRLWDES